MKIISHSPAQTLKIGACIGRHAKPGDIILLSGELGSGKTLLTKGIAKGLGLHADEVISPTFILLREYWQAKMPLYHFDLYRVSHECEVINIGYEEYFYGEGISVVEWPDRLKKLLPKDYLSIELSLQGLSKRKFVFKPCGKRAQEITWRIHETFSN